ncbi:MAG TPA: stage 0 sporulation protein [Spirochaetia bacterium]|nr:MAG: hypothetical protein A2Y41_06870 [Spirochaetes bacterium GWB1_36_13]HCL56089.1 stage 0 sporulation protein [Spirochaetia bacterium]
MNLIYMRVGYNKEVELFQYDEKSLEIKPNLLYIIETRHGRDMSYLEPAAVSFESYQEFQTHPEKFQKVLKPVSKEEFRKRNEMKTKSKEAFEVGVKKIKEHNLAIKLINVYCFFEGNKILFNFYSETRVDFRELVKELAGIFKTRIELHQVGIRDFSQFFNQIGICGRPFCCSTIKTHKKSISLKMAKEQNLHINASKLSGVCGRLMCCLNYEYDAYKELYKDFPEIGDTLYFKKGTYFIKEIDYDKKLIYIFNEQEEFEEISLEQYQKLKKPYNNNGRN